MKIYTGTSWSIQNQQKCADLGIGMMSSPVDPVHPNKIIKEVAVSGDNSAFRSYREGKSFDEKRFYNWLDSLDRRIDFVPYPDIPLGGMKSYEHSKKHLGLIPDIPAYFVVQDGMTFDLVYDVLSECDGCFIGGSTVTGKCKGWKWQTAPYWKKHCEEIGLPLHMGRCPGNLIGLDTAEEIGIDSIDVSTLIRHQLLDRVPQMERHRKEQKRLFL
jgi:hypothetical protein